MPQELPLAGLKVADFGTAIVGPYSARMLADFGATVVKVESETHPDVFRSSGPYKDNRPGPNRVCYVGPFNVGKQSLALDLRRPEGRQVARRLAVWADVLIETFTPRVMKGWGLDYEELSKSNPQLIMLSHCLLGQTGPRANYKGFGVLSAALAGMFEVTGWPDGPPLGPYAAYPDWIAPYYTVSSILGALEVRRRTGRGQYIDQAQIESALHFMAPAILDWSANRQPRHRSGNRDPHYCPHGVFRCLGEDQWCAVAVRSDEEWQALCRLLGREALGTHPDYATLAQRQQREAEIEALVEGWTARYSSHEAMQKLQAAGIPAGYVARSSDLFADPQLAHRGAFVELSNAEVGTHRTHTLPFLLSETPAVPRASFPLVGEHTDVVLSELLGYSAEEIAGLREAGVLK